MIFGSNTLCIIICKIYKTYFTSIMSSKALKPENESNIPDSYRTDTICQYPGQKSRQFI